MYYISHLIMLFRMFIVVYVHFYIRNSIGISTIYSSFILC